VHAQSEPDGAVHLRAAREGAWISFDGLSKGTIERHLAMTVAMREGGRLNQVLLSHDAGWYHVGEPDGGTYRPHDVLFTAFVPRLRERGFTDVEVQRLLVENPRRALTSI
jgi:predicted metal-dependent phosphotriesterase family hydrolase